MPPKSHRGKRGNRRGAGNSSQTENTLGCKEIKNDSTIINSAPIPSTHVKMVYIPPPPPPTQSNKITSLEFMSLLHSLEVPSSSSTTYHAQGIENPKNLCFRNVIVQSLLAVTPFRNFLQPLAMLCPSVSIPDGDFASWKEMIYLAEEVKLDDETSSSSEFSAFTSAEIEHEVMSSTGKDGDESKVKKSGEKDDHSLYQELLELAEKQQIREDSTFDEDHGWEEVSSTAKKNKSKIITTKTNSKSVPEIKSKPKTLMKDHVYTSNSSSGSSIACNKKYNLKHLIHTGNFSSYKVLPSVMSRFTMKMRQLNGNISNGVDYGDACAGMSAQEDAMEFMTFLLDTMHEELLKYEGDAEYVSNNSTAPRAINDHISDDGWEEVSTSRLKRRGKKVVDENSRRDAMEKTASTPISRLFHGTVRSEFKQKGSMLSVTFQRFHCLTLEIRDFKRPHYFRSSIEEALDAFFKPEHIQDSNAVKCANLDVLPPVLVLQFNRFTFDPYEGTPIKIDADVTYPMDLKLSSMYCTADLKIKLNEKQPMYSLCAVVMHHGNHATGGHYTVFAKTSVGALAWRRIDDTRVTAVSEEDVLSARKSAYLLFYSKNEC